MNASAPLLQEPMPATLDEAAIRFIAEPKHSELLERHRNAVLNLRARGATTAQIHDLLQHYGIPVSESAVVRFCRKNRTEWQRLRLEIMQGVPPIKQPAASEPVPTPSPTSSQQIQTPNQTAPKGQKKTDLRGEF